MRLTQAFVRSAAYERRFLAKNPWDLAMVLWIPLATVLLIWWIFSQTQISDLPIGVIDQDQSPMANTLVRYLEASPDITIANFYNSPAAAKDGVLQRDVYALVIIPENFSRNILSGKPSPIILQVNAQYGTHSGIIQKSVQSVAGTLSAGVEIQRLVKQGISPAQAAIAYSPINIQRTSLFNAATNYQQFLASTVIPALLHILAMVIGATTIGRELRDKQLGRWYRFIEGRSSKLSLATDSILSAGNSANDHLTSSSVSNGNNIKDQSALTNLTAPIAAVTKSVSISVLLAGLAGKYCWPALAYSLWALLAIWLATPQYPTALSSLLATYIGLVLLMMLSLWLGAIFTLASFSLRAGLSATGFISAPSYAFAGVTFPYIAISDSAKHWSDMLPLTYYLKLHIAQLQMHAPLAVSLSIVYGLALATIIAMLLTALLSKRALANPQRWGAR